MNIDIIKNHTKLSREVYRFWLDISHSPITLTLNQYASQYKKSSRHTTWLSNGFYDRLLKGDCTIAKPIVPDEIKVQLKAELIRMIDRADVE